MRSSQDYRVHSRVRVLWSSVTNDLWRTQTSDTKPWDLETRTGNNNRTDIINDHYLLLRCAINTIYDIEELSCFFSS